MGANEMTGDDDLRELEFGAFEVDLDLARIHLRDAEPGGLFRDWDVLMVSEAAVSAESLASAANALGAIAEERFGGEAEWFLSELDSPLEFDDPKIRTDISLRSLDSDTLVVQVKLGLSRFEDEEFEGRLPGLLEPLLKSVDAALWKITGDDDHGGELCLLLEAPDPKHWTVSSLIDLGLDARALALSLRGGPMDFNIACHLLKTGHAKALVGQREGPWLDAKSAPYDLAQEHQSFLLARLVSAFANSEGGLILVPASTRKVAGAEEIELVKDLDLRLVDVSQLRNSIDEWVYPSVAGLEIEAIETSVGRGYVFIHVPRQDPNIWPHLVRRAEVAGQLRAEVVLVFERHGDQVRAIDPGQLHSMLSRGKRGRDSSSGMKESSPS